MTTYAQQKARKEKYRANPHLIPDHVHGSVNGYVNYGCSCDMCKAAWAADVQRRKEARASRPVPEHVHGTPNGYGNYNCRCAPCTHAWTKDSNARAARRRQRKKEQEDVE